MFNSPLHRAVMTHVKTKIKAAETTYKAKLDKHEKDYNQALASAEQILKTNRVLALEESIQSVIKSLI